MIHTHPSHSLRCLKLKLMPKNDDPRTPKQARVVKYICLLLAGLLLVLLIYSGIMILTGHFQ